MLEQVQFVPDHPNKLISASVDGLICTFDTAGDIDDDDHMDSVIAIKYAAYAIEVIEFCVSAKQTHVILLDIVSIKTAGD